MANDKPKRVVMLFVFCSYSYSSKVLSPSILHLAKTVVLCGRFGGGGAGARRSILLLFLRPLCWRKKPLTAHHGLFDDVLVLVG